MSLIFFRSRETKDEKTLQARSTWIPLTHFPALLEHKSSRFYFVSRTMMPLNEEIALEELTANFDKPRFSHKSM